MPSCFQYFLGNGAVPGLTGQLGGKAGNYCPDCQNSQQIVSGSPNSSPSLLAKRPPPLHAPTQNSQNLNKFTFISCAYSILAWSFNKNEMYEYHHLVVVGGGFLLESIQGTPKLRFMLGWAITQDLMTVDRGCMVLVDWLVCCGRWWYKVRTGCDSWGGPAGQLLLPATLHGPDTAAAITPSPIPSTTKYLAFQHTLPPPQL